MAINLSGDLGGKIDEMLQGSVAGNISFTGGSSNLETLSVNANGTYTPSGDVDGYNEVIVNVPQEEVNLETLSVTTNGTYTPSGDVDGYDEVIVNVPQEEVNLETLSVTTNGTYTPSGNVDGYDEVIVNVQGDETDFYLDNKNIGGSTYTTVLLDKTIPEGTLCILSVLDGTSKRYITFTRTSGTQTINIPLRSNSNGSTRITDTTISLYDYSGEYRNILCKISKDKNTEDQFYI